MAKFKNKIGNIIEADTRKFSIKVDGVIYFRIPAPKYESRQDRLSIVLTALNNLDFELGAVIEHLKDDPIKPQIAVLRKLVADVDIAFPEVLELANELEKWKDNIMQTALANTDKFKDVVKTYVHLRDEVGAIKELELPTPDKDNEEYLKMLETLKVDLEAICTNLGYIFFPTMF